MKSLLQLIIILFSFSSSFAGIIVLEGKYQHNNVYVQNSYSDQGVGFCTYAVYVNGKLTSDEINSTAFEIDLEQFNFHYGDNVTVKIYHKDQCALPRILNPSALKPIPSFKVTQIKITNSGLLSWTTKDENGSLPYIIEQFRWNKWINVGEVQGTGTGTEHNYRFQVSSLHSGENKFRVKQVGYHAKYSSEVIIVSSTPRCVFSQSKNSKQIDFSCSTLYEVYDFYGSVVKKGYGSRIDIANLHKGGYYVCFDNSIGEIKKR